MGMFDAVFVGAIDRERLTIESAGFIEAARDARQQLLWIEGGGARAGLVGPPGAIYQFGLGCLALRAAAFDASPANYANIYRHLCAAEGFSAFEARDRRYAMYFPILAEDDGFIAIIEEEQRRFGPRPADQPVAVRRIAWRMQELRMEEVNLDWLPFLEEPPRG